MTTALITGATSGIGQAIAVGLNEAGYTVYAVGRNEAALEELRRNGPSISPICLDITDRHAVAAAVADLTIDVLINNAGIMPPLGNFAEMEIADIDAALEINLNAPILLTRLVLPQMCKRRSGHVIFTGSVAGHSGFANIAVYSATKAAIAGFAASLRADLSPHGVRVTEIVAGRVETRLYETILDEKARAAMYAGDVALQPEDVAKVVEAILALPERATVVRFDIVPTRPVTPSGTK
ncbi:MAG: SDR family oxidoreductase [Rhodospirillales bacterium]|nr:SDR family oxidoreductase [Rhodospirillales bacterium]